MIKFLLGVGSGLVLIKKVSGVSYLVIAHDLALWLGWAVLGLTTFSFLLGWLGGWLHGKEERELSLLKISSKSRVLILAPHPDDEVLALGGLISEFSKRKIFLKIVYLTNGDGNPSLFWRDKEIKFSPAKFVETGKERINEAIEAVKSLGCWRKNLVFLGYPDNCLFSMWRYPQNLAVSKTTKLNHSPYSFSFRKRREYRGINIVADIKVLLKKFKPTIVFIPHQKESNLDHRAVSFFFKKAVEDNNWTGQIYQYLVHYKILKFFRIYPSRASRRSKILYPPPRLWKNNQWFSFWLRPEQMKRKKVALSAYESQAMVPTLKLLFNSFLNQNEIFERANYSSKSSKR